MTKIAPPQKKPSQTPKKSSSKSKKPTENSPASVLLAGYSALAPTNEAASHQTGELAADRNEKPKALAKKSPRSPKANGKTTAEPASTSPSVEDPSKAKALLCARAAIDKNAENTKVLDLNGRSSLSDYFIICSGTSDRQVQAIADSVSSKMRTAGYKILSSEGYTEGRWLLMDYGDVIVHIFLDALREYYDLETLWQDAPQVKIPSEYYGPAASRLN